MSTRDINNLKREIQQKERRLKNMESVIKKLRSAARQTNNSPARKAVADAEDLMREVLRFEQEKLGEDHLIKQQGEMAEQVHTSDLTDQRGVRTNSRRQISGLISRSHTRS